MLSELYFPPFFSSDFCIDAGLLGARSKKSEAAAAVHGGLESGATQVTLINRPRDYTVTFSFPEVSQISPPILEVRDVNFRYGPTLPWLFRGVNFGLDMSSRVCIVGPNGSGKRYVWKKQNTKRAKNNRPFAFLRGYCGVSCFHVVFFFLYCYDECICSTELRYCVKNAAKYVLQLFLLIVSTSLFSTIIIFLNRVWILIFFI
jgi:hypothetical protein